MMPSTDQPRWFSHPHHPSGIPSSTAHPDVSVPGGTPFTSGMTPGPHHPSLNPYIESGGYLEDMESYLHHQPGYYGLNVQQYRAVHHRSISGKFYLFLNNFALFSIILPVFFAQFS